MPLEPRRDPTDRDLTDRDPTDRDPTDPDPTDPDADEVEELDPDAPGRWLFEPDEDAPEPNEPG